MRRSYKFQYINSCVTFSVNPILYLRIPTYIYIFSIYVNPHISICIMLQQVLNMVPVNIRLSNTFAIFTKSTLVIYPVSLQF